jgi:predicted nucleic acid-binding Zn ribbon protein
VSRNRPPRSSTPRPLGDILPGYLSRAGLTAKLETASVVPEWPDIVGPEIARVTEPLRVSGTTLFVAVESSPWMMELNLRKREILARANAGRRAGRIQELVFVMASGETRRNP